MQTYPPPQLNEPLLAAQSSALPLLQAGAYAIIANAEGHLLTVVAANGRHYLPGGRIEEGESARRALVREIAEECAWSAEVLGCVTRARQMILGGSVQLEASFWRVRLVSPLDSRPEHDLLWMSPSHAAAQLHRESDRRAVQMASGRLAA
jgi:8-oxo-dGTP pyrophosphatase MutT (NUDIX family)